MYTTGEPSESHENACYGKTLKHMLNDGVLAGCVSTWHRMELSQRRSLSWGNVSMRSSCKAFSQLVIKGRRAHCGRCYPWTGVLGSIRKQAEQARGSKSVNSTPPWPLHQFLPPSSCLVWVPVLTSFCNEQKCGSVSWINPLLFNLLLGPDVLCRNRNPYEDTSEMLVPLWTLTQIRKNRRQGCMVTRCSYIKDCSNTINIYSSYFPI